MESSRKLGLSSLIRGQIHYSTRHRREGILSIIVSMKSAVLKMIKEGRFNLAKYKFSSGSMRCFISLLLFTLCISGTGCMIGFAGGPSGGGGPILYRMAYIQQNQETWSQEEVDTVIDAVVKVAERYGFEMPWVPSERSFSLHVPEYGYFHIAASLGDDVSEGSCMFAELGGYDLLLNKKPPPFKYISFRKLDIQEARGSINLCLMQRVETGSKIDLFNKMWDEMLDPLRSKFGKRIQEGALR